MAEPLTVVHVITSLDRGGAETFLGRLIGATDPARVRHHVIALADGGALTDDLRAAGAAVESLGLQVDLRLFRRRRELVDRLRSPDKRVVQTWMYHADLVGGWAARKAGVRVAWNVRNSGAHGELLSRGARLARFLCALSSARIPSRIICPSKKAAGLHCELGYDGSRMRIIPNGFDTDQFAPNAATRAAIRAELGLDDEQLAVGLLARFNRFKDHANFAAAAGIVAAELPQARFVLAGAGVDAGNAELVAWLEAAGVRERTLLLGERDDPARIHNALDLFCLSSRGEAFPNVVAEAMACGVPAVVTDVGDAASIVGATGGVVPPEDSAALGAAVIDWLKRPDRAALGRAARERIVDRFSLAACARAYEVIWYELAGRELPA